MASSAYLSALDDNIRGAIDFDSDTFYVMLVTSSYAEDLVAHTKRSQVTNEVSGTGYSSGGQVLVPTVTKNTSSKWVDVVFPAVNWTGSTMLARKAIYYKRRGGASSADELVGVNDFGFDVSTTAGTFALAASTFRFALQ